MMLRRKKGRDRLQQKTWDEKHKVIKEVCWGKSSIPKIRYLSDVTKYSTKTIQKHVVELSEDELFTLQLDWKKAIEESRKKGYKGLDNRFGIFYEDYKEGMLVPMPDQSIETRGFLNHFVSSLVQSQLQTAFYGSLLEDSINREEAKFFIQYDESGKVPDKEYELRLRKLIPSCRVYVIYSFDSELLVKNLLQIRKSKDELAEEKALEDDLSRFLERKRK